MKAYIACALTHVPRDLFVEYASFIHNLASELRSRGHQVKYALANSDPQLAVKPFNDRAQLCYLWDREMVEEAEVVVAEASFPSTGLGIELQVAASKGTPIIICFRDYGGNRAAPVSYDNPDHTRHDLQIGEGYISLMALGLPTVFRVVRYSSLPDGISQVLALLELVERS